MFITHLLETLAELLRSLEFLEPRRSFARRQTEAGFSFIVDPDGVEPSSQF